MSELTPVDHDPWGTHVPVDHDPFTDPMTGFSANQPVGEFKRKNYIIEPTLVESMTGTQGIPEGAERNSETGEVYWKDTKEPIQMIRRPGILPMVGTPDGAEFVVPKIADLAGSIMGGIAAPVKGAGTVLGAGPVLRAGEKVAEQAPRFYSAVEHNLDAIPQARMTGSQWYNTLKNKPGVKPEEMDWRGLTDYLEANGKNPVTKSDIVSHLKNNEVKIQDVTRAEKGNYIDWENDPELFGDHIDTIMAERHPRVREGSRKYDDLREELEYELSDKMDQIPEKDRILKPNFLQYQLPGGTNYREHLLTLPEKTVPSLMSERYKHLDDTYVNWAKGRNGPLTAEENLERTNLRHQIDAIKRGENTYRGNHWEEPNVIAHMRLTDRDVGGKTSYHIEELQSDWHQAGREKGYIGDAPPLKWGNNSDGTMYTSTDYGNLTIGQLPSGKVVLITPRSSSMHESIEEAKKAAETLVGKISDQVPNAPFKKTWHELTLKRAIRDAAENGYDRISWTSGEHQPTNPKNFVQIGQEPDAAAIAADKGQREWYNKIIPDYMNKLGKKYGVKVERAEINKTDRNMGPVSGEEVMNWLGVPRDQHQNYWSSLSSLERSDAIETFRGQGTSHNIYYMDLPKEMKDHALNKGFPLFMKGIPVPVSPVDHDPYENNTRLIPVEHNPFEKLK